ncbi:MAG TPA: cytochrome c [Candidatus Udaeobacter sp.]|jgi:mono/diheme cytochrome c family protein
MVKFLLGLVIGAGLLLLAGYLFATRVVYMGTKGGPLPMEQFIANKAIEASIGKSSHDPSPLQADETNLLAGAKIYMQACAGCHGRLDQASSGAKGFYPLPPHLLPPGTGVTDDPVGAIHWIVENGIRFSAMPSFNQKLSDSEIWQVSLLLRNADKLPNSVQDSLRQPQHE